MLLLANRTASPTEACRLRQEVLEVRRKTLGPEDPETIMAMNYVAFSERDLGRLDEAVKLWNEALQLGRRVAGPEHPDTLMMLHNLADGYVLAGRQQEALKLREELLPLRRRVLGPEHPDTIIAMEGLGRSRLACGHPEDGCGLLEEALALRRKVLGPKNPFTTKLLEDLGPAYLAAGRLDEMQRLFESEIARWNEEGDLVQADRRLRWLHLGQGLAAYRKGHYPEASRALSDAALFGPVAVRRLAEFYCAMSLFQLGQVDEARRLFTGAEARMKPLPLDTQQPPNGTDRDDAILWLAYEEAHALLSSLGPPKAVATGFDSAQDVSAARAKEIRSLFEAELSRLSARLPKASTNGVFAIRLAALQAWFGKETEYLATSRLTLQWAAEDQGIWPADCAAKIISLRPSAEPQRRQMALTLARRNVALGQTNPLLSWSDVCLGMAEYRNGNYPEADRMFRAAVLAGSPNVVLTSKFYGAMSLFQQGQRDEARRLLTETEASMKPLPSNLQWPLADANHDELIIWLACQEARALLTPPQTSPP
ncbi:MAG: tetratricopeptide repeat protein, partial [Verrucomicrobiae bacterium]|nr:tetratricopeptide repeat protein [Verrucomicrobiae bacterium]